MCAQGLLTLFDVDETTGGLTVLPKTHLKHKEISDRLKWPGGDYVPIGKNDRILKQYTPKLVNAKAGDFCIWDSRTIHCNSPGIKPKIYPDGQVEMLRMVIYICMTPTKLASKKVLEHRSQAYEAYCGTTHWPHKWVPRPLNNQAKVKHGKLTPEMKLLIAGGQTVESNSGCNIS